VGSLYDDDDDDHHHHLIYELAYIHLNVHLPANY